MSFCTRFAPSPTGPLHLGHAYSALLARDRARACGGRFLLRIEDIDMSRARPAWEAQIYDDLRWLGIRWETPVMRQSDRGDTYGAALAGLWRRGLLYPCSCRRADIAAATQAPQEGAPLHGPDGLIYPGTCRPAQPAEQDGPLPRDTALRLDAARAFAACGDQPLAFQDEDTGLHCLTKGDFLQAIGDVVLARRDMGTSYHLSVVLDDAAQGITHVLRGRDLFEATAIHVLLQRLLGLPTPRYHHHRLIRDGTGKRLAKRDDARAISTYRAAGASPQDIRALVGLQGTSRSA